MTNKQIVGLVVAAIVFVFVGVSSAVTGVATSAVSRQLNLGDLMDAVGTFPVAGEYVGVIRISGIIQDVPQSPFMTAGFNHRQIIDDIREMRDSGNNRGMLIYLNTNGGSVNITDEIHNEIMLYREMTGRPVYVFQSARSFSGGVYLAMAGCRVYGDPNGWTGSISAVLSYVNLHGLFEDLGIRFVTLTTGYYKDAGSFAAESIDSHNAMFQRLMDEMHEQFVNVVIEGRERTDRMTAEQVIEISDGRWFTSRQAYEVGLIDGIARWDEVKDIIRADLGDNILIYEPVAALDFFSSLFGFAAEFRPQPSDVQLALNALENRGGWRVMFYVGY